MAYIYEIEFDTSYITGFIYSLYLYRFPNKQLKRIPQVGPQVKLLDEFFIVWLSCVWSIFGRPIHCFKSPVFFFRLNCCTEGKAYPKSTR